MLTIGLKSSLQFFMKPANYKVLFACLSWHVTCWYISRLSWSLTSAVRILCYLIGYNIIWGWIFLCRNRMAHSGNDFGGLWLCYPLQVNCTLPGALCSFCCFWYYVLLIWLFSFLPCSGFWPTLAVFLQKIPVLGWVFQQPYIRSVCFVCNLWSSYYM